MKIRIKEARDNYERINGHKISMQKLAELVFVENDSSPKTKIDLLFRMQRGEHSHPSLDALSRICDICDVDLNFLIDRESVMKL